MKLKDLPLWVREGHGNRKFGSYHWEYQKDCKYYAHGFYHTPEEAHQACLNHQKEIELTTKDKNEVLI